MTDRDLLEIRDLFCRWTSLRDDRVSCGELRPSKAEAASFVEYVERLEQLDPKRRDTWNERRREIECRPPLPRCDCGHAEALHVDGSCFTMVGCATTCDCTNG